MDHACGMAVMRTNDDQRSRNECRRGVGGVLEVGEETKKFGICL